MRPAGIAQAGFYPATEGLIRLACRRLKAEVPEAVNSLDPCIGEGVAFKQLIDHLGLAEERACGVELTRNRGAAAQALLPRANIISPADFISGVTKPSKQFSFIYCNSPYADEIGGGQRMEASFAEKCAQLLCNYGIGLFVVPERIWLDNFDFRRVIAQNFIDVSTITGSPEESPYTETLVFGVRKDHGLKDWSGGPIMQMLPANKMAEPYVIPPVGRPVGYWHKTVITDEELREHLLTSEIETNVDVPKPIQRGTPPLALGEGHNGMLVASGQAPPVVVRRDAHGRMLEIPHLVRGVSRKAQVLVSEEEIENEDGTMSNKEVYTETFVLEMTVLTHEGKVIHLKPGSAADGDKVQVKKTLTVLPGAGTKAGQHGGIAV